MAGTGDTRNDFKLSANGALAVGVADRQQTTANGEVTTVAAVIGTLPTGANTVVQVRLEGTVLGTLTFVPGGATEQALDVPDTQFSAGQTFDLNVTAIGTTPGNDLDVTVGYVGR